MACEAAFVAMWLSAISFADAFEIGLIGGVTGTDRATARGGHSCGAVVSEGGVGILTFGAGVESCFTGAARPNAGVRLPTALVEVRRLLA